MDLIKRNSEHIKNKNKTRKLTNRFSNDIGHVIGDKVRLNGSE